MSRDRRKPCAIEPVHYPDIPGKGERGDQWPIAMLLAHKRSPPLPRRLAKNAIFCCIWIVKFNIGKTVMKANVAHPPAVRI
ncbi:MAG: hypothetical protein E6Y46_17010 [Escherichia coli]|nr:hypothetical protein [Escherichia coli]